MVVVAVLFVAVVWGMFCVVTEFSSCCSLLFVFVSKPMITLRQM